MLSVHNILFPTDFSECAEHAFSHAAELAALFDAKVHVFHTRVRPLSYHPALKHLLDEAERLEERDHVPHEPEEEKRLRAPVGDQAIVISAEKTGASAYEEILAYSQDEDIDLIVMGTHGRRGPRRLFIGSTAERVVRLAKCPVLTLRSDAETMQSMKLERLLVPVDFSSYSEESLRYASELASMWDARVTLLNVIEETVLPTVYGIEPVSLYPVDHLLDESKKALEKLRSEYFDPMLSIDTAVVIGHAATTIADFAKDSDTDLIVISTHGLTGMRRFLMGSVSEHVTRNAPCAVLTVKPFGKSLISEKEDASENTASAEHPTV